MLESSMIRFAVSLADSQKLFLQHSSLIGSIDEEKGSRPVDGLLFGSEAEGQTGFYANVEVSVEVDFF